MLKNTNRFVEAFKNYASYIHTFSLTVNLQNSRKKGKKENLVFEAVFRRCSIIKVFLKVSQSSQENTCARQKQLFRGFLEKRYSENMQQVYRRIPMPKCDFKATLLKSRFGTGILLQICCIFSEHLFLRIPLSSCF